LIFVFHIAYLFFFDFYYNFEYNKKNNTKRRLLPTFYE